MLIITGFGILTVAVDAAITVIINKIISSIPDSSG